MGFFFNITSDRLRVHYDDDLLKHTNVPEDYKNEVEEHLSRKKLF